MTLSTTIPYSRTIYTNPCLRATQKGLLSETVAQRPRTKKYLTGMNSSGMAKKTDRRRMLSINSVFYLFCQ